jgi:hypothetical protein
MAETNWIEKEIARVVAAGRAAPDEEREPHALSARYDNKHGRVVVELDNGCLFAFPARHVQGLEEADAKAIADIELLGGGYALHWPRINASLRIEGALAGIFGNRKWMHRLAAKEAGSKTSEKKASTSRENGKKGGRPRKAETEAA